MSRQQPLQDLHRIAAGVDIHVEDRWPAAPRGKAAMPGRLIVMLDDRSPPPARGSAPCTSATSIRAVAVQVDPQPAQRADGDAVVGGPARIVGVVHKAALAGDDLFGNLADRSAWAPPSQLGAKPAAKRL